VTEGRPLQATGLRTWSVANGEPKASGAIEWSNGGWTATGDAGWLLTEYVAMLPVDSRDPRHVRPDEGLPFLYAVCFSMRSRYYWVTLVDADGNDLDGETVSQDIEALARTGGRPSQ
jgi:hypothetical protein